LIAISLIAIFNTDLSAQKGRKSLLIIDAPLHTPLARVRKQKSKGALWGIIYPDYIYLCFYENIFIFSLWLYTFIGNKFVSLLFIDFLNKNNA
jgi:hypothetical protein